MATGSNSRKVASSEKHDKISELPDLIIGEILSSLPTKQAVATSILSKRWRYLWTSIRNLDFHFGQRREGATTFVEVVDRVLSKCTTREFHKFYLDARWCDSHDVHRWVNEAIVRNVQMLKLNVRQFPTSVLTCRSLTSLEHCVSVENMLDIPDSFDLPKLRVVRVSFRDKSAQIIAQKLVRSCPVLEDLALNTYRFQSTFVISLPFLKRLRIFTWCYSSIEKEYKLVIDAPQLQYMKILSRGRVPSYVIKNVGPEAEAIIDVGQWNTDQGTRCNIELLINRLSGVKSLTLRTQTLRVLGSANPKMLPIFSKLNLLELVMQQLHGWDIISDLLQASPSLEVFIVKMSYDNGIQIRQCLEVEDPEFRWIEPQHVPSCLSSRLQVVELYCEIQEVVKQELEMVKYLLGNGEVLKKLLVKASRLIEKLDFRNKLLTFPRASKYCEVQVL